MKLSPPSTDDLGLIELVGVKGYVDDVPLVQFPAWAVETGLFDLLAERGTASENEIVAATPLTEAGVDAIVGVLATIGLIRRRSDGLSLSIEAREYLVPASPFYMGDSLFLTCQATLPGVFVESDVNAAPSILDRLRRDFVGRARRKLARTIAPTPPQRSSGWHLGGHRRLENQHSRNLPAAVAAAQLSIFDGASCVIDVGGGTGTFAIPLAQRQPETRIVLTDLPEAIKGIREFLRNYDGASTIEVVAMNALADTWPIPACDVVFFGNLIHIFDDKKSLAVVRTCREKLRPGGKVVLHELIWNENKDGPLKTALFNVTMRSYDGKQRTVLELHEILRRAGFDDLFALPTAGGFYAVGGSLNNAPGLGE